MFNNVIVGVDEQQGGRDAIALAKDLRAEGGGLALAHVHGVETGPVRWLKHESRAAAGRHSLELLGARRDEAGVEADLICIGSPSVGRGLHDLVVRERADLLVVGSYRGGLIGRVFVNDNTQHALNGAPCAVAVAPAGYSEHAHVVRQIGVAYDASPESRFALAVAREHAASLGAKLSAFEAVSLPPDLFSAGEAPVHESIVLFVDQALRRIVALGDVEPFAVYGDAAEELAVYSGSVDMLFVGSRGHGPVGRLVNGSTSQQLARTARCPLVVLTRSPAAAEAPARTDTAVAAEA